MILVSSPSVAPKGALLAAAFLPLPPLPPFFISSG